jgi:thioredoxin 2
MVIVTCSQCGAKNRVDEGRAATVQPVCGRCGAKLELSGESAEPIELTDATFEAEVLDARDGRPILVDCWAPWCGPCRLMDPIIRQLAAEANGRWRIAKLNTDQNPRTAASLGIEGIPTLFIFRNGQIKDKMVGAGPKERLLSMLTRATL